MQTVLVKGQNGDPVMMNADEYEANPGDYTLLTREVSIYLANGTIIPPDGEAPAPAAPATEQGGAPTNPNVPPSEAAVSLGVQKKGKKFMVVTPAGDPAERDGIDPEGYKSEGEAWAAIMALPPVPAAS